MLGLGYVWVQSLRLSLWLPFKIHSQLTSGQEVGWGWECPSEIQFQEIGLCFSLSTISQTSLMESANAVIENTVSQVLFQTQRIGFSRGGVQKSG